jgi:hypothetical protein
MKRSLLGSFRPLIGAGGLALAIALLPAAASAAGPIHTNYSYTVPNDSICGITVTASITGVDNFWPVYDANGNPVSFFDTGNYRVTFTAANGKSLVLSYAGQETGTFTMNPDGTITFMDTFKGVPEKFSSPQGGTLTRDAGIITLAKTLSSSWELISWTVAFQSGPHPDADSGSSIYCQVVTAALT